MPAYKDENKGTWYVQFYFKDWQGKQTKKLKRGFATKKEGQNWEREFLQQKSADMSMTFENFVEVYSNDMKNRLKENSWLTKEHILKTKILPYFSNKKLNEIEPRDVIQWQNTMMEYRNAKGKAYSPVYLKTLHNQLSATLNHAVRFYGLQTNSAQKAGNMGKEKGTEVDFWTKEEYLLFLDEMRDKPLSYYAFQLLYWCGIRMGELLALISSDIDLQEKTLNISKSYQRIKGKDVITDPKTEKSKRIITIPEFLAEELEDFLNAQYALEDNQRLFPISKSYLHHEMNRGCEKSGVKRIKVHSLRHSHVSLLIELGFSAVAIADRVGHESISITLHYPYVKQKLTYFQIIFYDLFSNEKQNFVSIMLYIR